MKMIAIQQELLEKLEAEGMEFAFADRPGYAANECAEIRF